MKSITLCAVLRSQLQKDNVTPLLKGGMRGLGGGAVYDLLVA